MTDAVGRQTGDTGTMQALKHTLCAAAMAVAMFGPATAVADDDDERHYKGHHHHSWKQGWSRKGPPPWARSRHNREPYPEFEVVEPDTSFEGVEYEDSTYATDEVACSDADQAKQVVGVMLEAALAALSRTDFASPVGQAAATAAGAAVDGDGLGLAGSCAY